MVYQVIESLKLQFNWFGDHDFDHNSFSTYLIDELVGCMSWNAYLYDINEIESNKNPQFNFRLVQVATYCANDLSKYQSHGQASFVYACQLQTLQKFEIWYVLYSLHI